MAKKPAGHANDTAAKTGSAKTGAAKTGTAKTAAATKARSAKARATKAAQAKAKTQAQAQAQARSKAKAQAARAKAKADAAAQAQAASFSDDDDYVDPTAAMNAASGFGMGGEENYLDMLTNVFGQMSAGSGWDPQQFDSMTRGMELVLGSGPAFAALGTMMANTTAQGAVLMNAAQTQRQLDQVGLCCTSACVKQLLSMNNNNGGED